MNKNMKRQPSVYGLRAGSVFGYVGSTQVNPKTRWWEHRSRARNGHTAPVYEWMRSVGIEDVEIVILAEGENLEEHEVAWIKKLLAEGHPLQNQVSIDGVLHSWSDYMKRKSGDPRKGKKTWIAGRTGEAAGWTPERREAQSRRISEINRQKKN